MFRYLGLFILICSLSWSYEGLYEVELRCEDRTNPNCMELNRKARLAIIKTPQVIAVSIGYPEQSLSRYAFTSEDTSITNERYVGIQSLGSDSVAQFSQIQIEFSDDEDGNISISGQIRDARFLKDITVTGQRILPIDTLSRDDNSALSPTLPASQEGRFLARGKNRTWLLTIRKAFNTLVSSLASSGEGELLAEITDLGNPTTGELASGERTYLKSMRNENNQLEFFTPLSQEGAFLKWVLHSDTQTLFRVSTLNGFFYSSNGVYSPLTLERL